MSNVLIHTDFVGAPKAGAVLVSARQVAEGDEVCFRASFANYVVEDVDTDCLGRVRHQFENGSSCYDPGEMLWVVRGGWS